MGEHNLRIPIDGNDCRRSGVWPISTEVPKNRTRHRNTHSSVVSPNGNSRNAIVGIVVCALRKCVSDDDSGGRIIRYLVQTSPLKCIAPSAADRSRTTSHSRD